MEKTGFWHKALTIAITVMIVAIGFMINSVRSNTESQHQLEIVVAVMSKSINDHNISASDWIAKIKDNDQRITNLETGTTLATYDRITRTEALEAIRALEKNIEKNYQQK